MNPWSLVGEKISYKWAHSCHIALYVNDDFLGRCVFLLFEITEPISDYPGCFRKYVRVIRL
jgi:hypothetical protein